MNCPACGYPNPQQALTCSMCSEVLQRKSSTHEDVVSHTAADQSLRANPPLREGGVRLNFDTPTQPSAKTAEPLRLTPEEITPAVMKSWEQPVFKERSGKYHVGVGLAVALIFCLPFFLFRTIGWVFESVVHEMGHTLMAYFMGSIALPALRLDGHAATVHLDQWPLLALAVWLILILASVYFGLSKKKPLMWSLASLAVVYPFFAFTESKEFLHLISGHGGELVIATVFFWRSMMPGKVLEEERTLYATLAWYLWLQNIFLSWNLVFSEASRDWYLENGSFGLENDLVRIADSFSWDLSFLAGGMLIFCLAVPPMGLLWARWSLSHPKSNK